MYNFYLYKNKFMFIIFSFLEVICIFVIIFKEGVINFVIVIIVIVLELIVLFIFFRVIC